jgi:peptidoglycan/xylan/chitin deacetylase (PgdA/CDA1 family)
MLAAQGLTCEDFCNMSPLPELLATGGVLAASGVFSWAATAPSAQLFGQTLLHTGDPLSLALTFDDGPNPAATPALLDLLEKHGARATFFMIGQHIRAFPDLARQIAERGHGVGNHTETHPRLTFLPPSQIGKELDRCEEAIAANIGRRARWMRPPWGYRGPQLQRVIGRKGYEGVVMWSISGRDWKQDGSAALIERLRPAKGGDIVLLHDGDHKVPEGNRQSTIDALAYWVPRWKDAGMRLVSLDDV